MVTIVSEEQIIKVLRQYNPWWIDEKTIYNVTKPQKRLAFYEALKTFKHTTIRRFAVLSGVRRVGKTTILYQSIETLLCDGTNPKNILYVTFDNPILKLVSIDTIIKTYMSMYSISGDLYFFFDEIQYTDSWEMWMKVIYDSYKNVHLMATGSASPILEKGSADSGTGRWSVIKIPTMSFYEYCMLLNIKEINISGDISLSRLASLKNSELGDLSAKFSGLLGEFNRYLMVGGFPELALANDDYYAQRMLREDVVDKVIKRDVLSLFNVRNPLLMEKLFLYLCINSGEVFNTTTAAKELENISVTTIEVYLKALEMSNLIYLARPMQVGSKAVLKGKAKIYIADAAIRNAVLMIDDVLEDPKDLGIMVETAVYKHILSYYQNKPAQIGYYRKLKDNQKEIDVVVELPRKKLLYEVKYRNNSHIPETDAIVEICSSENNKISNAFIITKALEDYGVTSHNTSIPILRIPAIVFLYLLGREEKKAVQEGF